MGIKSQIEKDINSSFGVAMVLTFQTVINGFEKHGIEVNLFPE